MSLLCMKVSMTILMLKMEASNNKTIKNTFLDAESSSMPFESTAKPFEFLKLIFHILHLNKYNVMRRMTLYLYLHDANIKRKDDEAELFSEIKQKPIIKKEGKKKEKRKKQLSLQTLQNLTLTKNHKSKMNRISLISSNI